MATQSKGGHARGGTSAIWGALSTILVIEAIVDIIGLPFDEILIPMEAIGDTAFVAVALLGTLSSNRGSGRQIGSKRGVVGLRRSRRAVGGNGIAVIAFWAFFVAILLFQWWFAIHHPAMTVLLFIFELGFDAMMLLFGAVITVMFLVGGRSNPSRQVGA